jgi:hypothetical protein
VTWAAAATPGLALLLLLVVLGGAEWAARSRVVYTRLLVPTVGSPARPFDLQVARLDLWVQRNGNPDCFFLGSSLALTGFEPGAFEAAFAAAGGRRIRCFNLGVPGTTAADVTALAGLVVPRYRPWLIVYGASFRDFNAGVVGPGIATMPWVRHRLGDWNVEGWLVEHSRAYRYYLTYRGWSDPMQRYHMQRGFPGDADGFWPMPVRPVDYEALLDKERELFLQKMPPDRMAPEQLAAFDVLLGGAAGDAEIVVVEMPGPHVLTSWLTPGKPYRTFRERLRAIAQTHRAHFWENGPEVPEDELPADGWRDLVHMNDAGAAALSRWLGERVAAGVADGELRAPPPEGDVEP